ncbi:hypothetical protein [Bacillus sp. EB01]|uniref:hypothetical protein n=1 Tax=Bacillus sp. EB01 TaxID=1347086 RepID=UPI0005C45E91|nr:hypothetical protein [Bacillus sp. EB01]
MDEKLTEKEDRFSKMMFGARRNPEPEKGQENPLFEILNGTHSKNSIDYALLLDVIDKLADSAEKLKPVISKVYPQIQQIWKS